MSALKLPKLLPLSKSNQAYPFAVKRGDGKKRGKGQDVSMKEGGWAYPDQLVAKKPNEITGKGLEDFQKQSATLPTLHAQNNVKPLGQGMKGGEMGKGYLGWDGWVNTGLDKEFPFEGPKSRKANLENARVEAINRDIKKYTGLRKKMKTSTRRYKKKHMHGGSAMMSTTEFKKLLK